jgi:hypothetical protein
MRPSLGVSKPASMRSNVVLPQPDGQQREEFALRNFQGKRFDCGDGTEALADRLETDQRCSSACPWSAPPPAIDSPFAAHTLAARAGRSTR